MAKQFAHWTPFASSQPFKSIDQSSLAMLRINSGTSFELELGSRRRETIVSSDGSHRLRLELIRLPRGCNSPLLVLRWPAREGSSFFSRWLEQVKRADAFIALLAGGFQRRRSSWMSCAAARRREYSSACLCSAPSPLSRSKLLPDRDLTSAESVASRKLIGSEKRLKKSQRQLDTKPELKIGRNRRRCRPITEPTSVDRQSSRLRQHNGNSNDNNCNVESCKSDSTFIQPAVWPPSD